MQHLRVGSVVDVFYQAMSTNGAPQSLVDVNGVVTNLTESYLEYETNGGAHVVPWANLFYVLVLTD